MAKLPSFPSIDRFLFGSPLYAKYSLGETLEHVEILYGRVPTGRGQITTNARVDGYCPHCKRESTFVVDGISIPGGDPWTNIKSRHAFDRFTISCTRNENHSIWYFVLINNMVIEKVGQSPSLADIAIDETRQKYRTVLKGDNWSEFYKAIGLAAHGEGIGSFVYLRRVFERLIKSRFEEYRDSEGWTDEAFYKLRMDEKVAFLKDHLPPYLVEIRKIYSIFSQGIHELDNEKCLEFFEVGKRSIIIVLEDDLKHNQELLARKEMAEAVRKFSGDPDVPVVSGESAGSELPAK